MTLRDRLFFRGVVSDLRGAFGVRVIELVERLRSSEPLISLSNPDENQHLSAYNLQVDDTYLLSPLSATRSPQLLLR